MEPYGAGLQVASNIEDCRMNVPKRQTKKLNKDVKMYTLSVYHKQKSSVRPINGYLLSYLGESGGLSRPTRPNMADRCVVS